MKPFGNIRVIDLTHVIAGPFCTYQLAALGAEVIKIESPHEPDMMRVSGPDEQLLEAGMGIHFLSQNAAKKSLVLDFKAPRGRAILEKLIAQADVLVENFRGSVMQSMQLGHAQLMAINPALIYCSISGFGHSGPKAHHPAYDNVIQAYSGLMYATGSAETGPVKIGPPVLDYGTGGQAALAIAAALFQRQASGEGQYIDVSMLDCALMLMASSVTETLHSGQSPDLPGNSNADNAGYGVYQAQDSLLMIGAYTPRQLAAMWTVLEQPELAEQLRHYDYLQIKQHAAAHRQQLAELIARRKAEEWEDLFNASGVPAARVRKLDETLVSEQLASRQLLQQVDHPLNPEATLSLPVAAYSYAADGPGIKAGVAPRSQHTHGILRDLGLAEDEIAELAEQGIIGVQMP